MKKVQQKQRFVIFIRSGKSNICNKNFSGGVGSGGDKELNLPDNGTP